MMSGNFANEDLTPGYPQLSGYMGFFPHLGIVRSFSGLGYRNILYLHAELVSLEAALHKVEKSDEESSDPVRTNYRRCWQWLKTSESAPSSEMSQQCHLVLEIRKVLKEYCEPSPELHIHFGCT
jgi:hypothetical protein